MKALIAINNLKTNTEARIRGVLPESMSVQQWMVIDTLCNVDKPTAGQVADSTAILGPSMARIIRDLKEQGLIKSRPCTADKRALRLSVTTDGGKLYRKYKTRVTKAMQVKHEDLNQIACIISDQYGIDRGES